MLYTHQTHTNTHTNTHSPVVPEVKMYRVGVLREVQARNSAGRGWSDAASSLSSSVCTCAFLHRLLMVHTWILSSSSVVRMPSRLSTKSGYKVNKKKKTFKSYSPCSAITRATAGLPDRYSQDSVPGCARRRQSMLTLSHGCSMMNLIICRNWIFHRTT